jgi:ArsR family transcriptional regulator
LNDKELRRYIAALAILPNVHVAVAYNRTMTTSKQESLRRYESRARVIKAIAHPSRLLMMEALSNRPHCVCELTVMVGSDTSTVSKHLSVLRNAGLVESERRGSMLFYMLRSESVGDMVGSVDRVVRDGLNAQMAAAK